MNVILHNKKSDSLNVQIKFIKNNKKQNKFFNFTKFEFCKLNL